jgi:hypothetical protein
VTQYFGYDAVLPMNTGAEAGARSLGLGVAAAAAV